MPRLPMKFWFGLWLAKLRSKVDLIFAIAFLVAASAALGLAGNAGLERLANDAVHDADQLAKIAEMQARLERMNQTMNQLELECKR